MAHAHIPEEELRPLIASLERVLRPITDLAPAVTMIPSELDRIGDNIEDDMMSGIPDRLEAVHERVTMDLGTKILEMQEKATNSFGARMLRIQADIEKKKAKMSSEKQRELKDKLIAKREERLLTLRERGLAVEIKNNRVQFMSEKDIAKKQKENIRTQQQILKKERELQKLVEKGEKGSENKITQLINELTKLQEKEGTQSQELGDKRKEAKGILGTVRAGAESILPEPIMGAFDEFGANIAEVGNNLKSFGKPFMALGKVVNKRFGITEKLQKLEVARYALALKQFALEKAKFALDMLAVLKNPFVLIGIAIAAFIGTLYAFNDEIKAFINGIGESIANFGKSIYNAFANSAIGKFFGMEAYDMPADEKETPAQIEANNVAANVEAAGPLGALAEARETGTEKLARLKGEAGEMMKERLATNIVNMVSDNTSQTSLAVNPTVPKSTSADALALNPTG